MWFKSCKSSKFTICTIYGLCIPYAVANFSLTPDMLFTYQFLFILRAYVFILSLLTLFLSVIRPPIGHLYTLVVCPAVTYCISLYNSTIHYSRFIRDSRLLYYTFPFVSVHKSHLTPVSCLTMDVSWRGKRGKF